MPNSIGDYIGFHVCLVRNSFFPARKHKISLFLFFFFKLSRRLMLTSKMVF